MRRITPRHHEALFRVASTQAMEQAAARKRPPNSLMQRAGLATARLALALAPHARSIWIACGPGNNGGDGLLAAAHLQQRGKAVHVSWLGSLERASADTAAAHAQALAAGVRIEETPPEKFDLCIDALLGIGAARAPGGRLREWIMHMQAAGWPVLAVDLPSGLLADTGALAAPADGAQTPLAVTATWTLSLLTLKPGLFTAQGRDHAGEVWFDDLGVSSGAPDAWLAGADQWPARTRHHAGHKGSWGDVAVIGGAPGMTGAALLAGSAALHAGAGRVFVALLDPSAAAIDTAQPELMWRAPEALPLAGLSVACGCGGGTAVQVVLPRVLSLARQLVLDADALNALAQDSALQQLLRQRQARGLATVLTPHPLEAARLRGCSAAEVQIDRLSCAQALAEGFGCVVVLKGSGTVIAAPGTAPVLNPTGNARLATAGTGDVLAGWIAARLALGLAPLQAACEAVFAHGQAADEWAATSALTAGALARLARP